MNNSETFYLIDILNIINYNINSILDTSYSQETTIKQYKNSIMCIIKTLETNKNWEYLYICILLISSRICDEAITKYLQVDNLTRDEKTEKDLKLRYQLSLNDSFVFFKKENNLSVKLNLFYIF
jgi:hypothetical protein